MSFDISRLTRRIFAIIRGGARGKARWKGLVGIVGRPLGIQQRVAQHADLGDPRRIPPCALEFALFPRAPRNPRADPLRLKSKLDSWKREVRRVRGNFLGPNWKHAGLTDKISVAFPSVLHRVDRFALWRITCIRGTESANWVIIPPREPPTFSAVSCICLRRRRLEILEERAVAGCASRCPQLL